jgi:glycosyltransferase involved in cell wall biosynthesis
MTIKVSVVIPVYNGEESLPACLNALQTQLLSSDLYEVIVVDDGSEDRSAEIAEAFNVILVKIDHSGEAAGRNTGVSVANGKWVAFTDADCIPTRRWLQFLVQKVEGEEKLGPVLGAAGPIIGFNSNSPAARYTDISGGLNTRDHLNHPVFPYAPLGNAMYKKESLNRIGGIDERFIHYPGPDLQHRLKERFKHSFFFVPEAAVLHQHRKTWKSYWKQQVGYGIGYAQFLILYQDLFPWNFTNEAFAWLKILKFGLQACIPRARDAGLLKRGRFIQYLAQRIGFDRTYWDAVERSKWSNNAGTEPLAGNPAS